MGVIGNSGIEVRQAGNRLLFRQALVDGLTQKLSGGTTTLRLYEMQDDGTLEMFDFDDNTFKATAVTTPTAAMSHQTVNAGETTGIWTYVLATLTAFTAGAIYMVRINNTTAAPDDTYQEFQYGGAASDDERDSADRWLGAHEHNMSTGVHTFTRRDGTTELMQRSLSESIVAGETLVIWDAP